MPGLLYTHSQIHSFFRSTQQLDHVSCCGISGAEGENGTKWAWRHRRSCQWIKRKEMFDFFSEGRLEKHLVGCRFNGTPHKSRKNKKDSFLVWCVIIAVMPLHTPVIINIEPMKDLSSWLHSTFLSVTHTQNKHLNFVVSRNNVAGFKYPR
jgi:hypothetical protein